MGNIIPVGIRGRRDVNVWLDEVSREETLIFEAVALNAKDNAEATDMAKAICGNEMLILRHQGYEMPEGFKPEVTEREIDGTEFQVTMYRFVESAWKRKVTKKDEKKA